jgi:hypothetical protein
MFLNYRSQWPRGLKRRSAAARLQRSRVGIPPGAWIFVCCECCVLSGRGLCDKLITRPEESYRLWCVVVCDLETSRPALVRSVTQKKVNIYLPSLMMKVPNHLYVLGDTYICHTYCCYAYHFYAYWLYFIYVWHVYVSPKTYKWSGTFILNLLAPEFYI